MRLRGKLAELMVKVAPEIYTKYVIINSKGETVLYVRLLNALYGIMKAALLYYQRFDTDLKSIGFEINPYDPCVANKVVKGCPWRRTLCAYTQRFTWPPTAVLFASVSTQERP
jgi:hypothetical protein